MKKIFLLMVLFCSMSMVAETYTIVFNSSNSDSSSPTSDLNSIVYSATANCVEEIRTANNVYRAKDGYGVKGGKASGKGVLTIGLDDTYHITTMTIYAATYPHAKDTAAARGFYVYDHEFIWEAGNRTIIHPYQLTLNSDVDSIYISGQVASYNRWYVQKIEFEAENPHPSQAILEMPYASPNFGEISWVSADEPMEDALDFEINGKNTQGNITLSMKTGTKFSITPTTLPDTGGTASVFYSFTLDGAPAKATPYRDTVIATVQGTDNVVYIRKMPVVVTVKPQSSGATTFVLDTTRIAIGPMPGDYYKYAQGTADSTLKNHLGYIICTGQRYRYGSGNKKSWDAFFHTDRDTLTNEVLDMYSNNHRYFDPENPTASVSGFDIEHMLPKSWWGGKVNPAYCDIFHLVPGDYSANRSKSNHAPGMPADSSFNNGSFITGSGAAYGLTRVFCPADEYKGDFARAYFYIATCYGDSLEWLTTGEPSVAMTNEGWEEFQPWLQDLLLDWHRLDPVSEKEKTRAIEVNKIQGNRNPFIDYPDLAEYIWGNKKGTPVNFYNLTQSYGDAYNDDPTGVCNTPAATSPARKEIREGQIVIIRNTSIYTTLGQQIR